MQEKTVFEIIHNMDKVTNNLIVQWNKVFNEDLGVSHILVLGHLFTNGKSRPSDMAKTLGLTPPTVTHLTEKLVKKQLVTRSFDESDRRIVYLEITNTGETLLKQANEAGQILRKELFGKLTDEEQQQMLHIYRKLNNE
ncbi:MarR family winged helix-turn-helix transcriptional regulator [Oceanobacillus sp. Castelsardo]|uniref:MarR family winged helix-turn-helix transcriptional regulator n=1 Tax=Oceanobacillus sp. Castelsardo TaxID=1851204 RepID=UPI000837AA0A|nr:MarR family transcriptional regulator [Oceanobacillus sp. Castelsardo]